MKISMENYKDQELRSWDTLEELLKNENLEQVEKWGVQNATLPEWMLYLTEEVGELANAIAEFIYRIGSKKEVQKEAIQVATLSLKIAEMME